MANLYNKNHKPKKLKSGLSLYEIEKMLKDGEDQMYLADVDLKRSNHELLVFRKSPYT